MFVCSTNVFNTLKLETHKGRTREHLPEFAKVQANFASLEV